MPLGRLYSRRDDHPIQCCSVVGQQVDKRQRQRCREVLPDLSIEFQQGDGRLESQKTEHEKKKHATRNSRAENKSSVSETYAGGGDSYQASAFSSSRVCAAEGQRAGPTTRKKKKKKILQSLEAEGGVGIRRTDDALRRR